MILAETLPWAFVAILFAILHLEAKRRGGSIWKDIGPKGWIVAILTAFSAGLFASVVVNGLQTPYNVPLDWTPFLIEAPIFAGVGLLVFAVARREFLRASPKQASTSAPPMPRPMSRTELVIAIVAVVIVAIAIVTLFVVVWYPTTLQPSITMTDASYVTGTCVPVQGGFGNRFNWTFTLVNTGSADGDASVQFLLNGNSIGFIHYFVPQHSQVPESSTNYGAIYPTSVGCNAPETPGISLASVTKA